MEGAVEGLANDETLLVGVHAGRGATEPCGVRASASTVGKGLGHTSSPLDATWALLLEEVSGDGGAGQHGDSREGQAQVSLALRDVSG